MPTTNNAPSDKVAQYLENLPGWSQPLCKNLREIIRQTDGEIMEEWKWGPHYSCHGMVCGWSAFQKHVKLTFFNGAGLTDAAGLFNHCTDNQFSRSIKITSLEAINAPLLQQYIRDAIALNKSSVKRTTTAKELAVPDALQAALANDKNAEAYFSSLPYTCKKEYVQWITSARQEQTAATRIAATVAQCAKGLRWHNRPKKQRYNMGI